MHEQPWQDYFTIGVANRDGSFFFSWSLTQRLNFAFLIHLNLLSLCFPLGSILISLSPEPILICRFKEKCPFFLFLTEFQIRTLNVLFPYSVLLPQLSKESASVLGKAGSAVSLMHMIEINNLVSLGMQTCSRTQSSLSEFRSVLYRMVSEVKVSRKKMSKDTRLHTILHNCLNCHEIGSFVSYVVIMFYCILTNVRWLLPKWLQWNVAVSLLSETR